jgi:hypothetical protein
MCYVCNINKTNEIKFQANIPILMIFQYKQYEFAQ